MEIVGASVIVTGGARGIGRMVARMFLERGASVTICALHAETLGPGLDELRSLGPVDGVVADVSTAVGCEAVVERAVLTQGRLDVLVANAGLYREVKVEAMTEEDWGMVVDANLKSAFFSVHAALPALRETQGAVALVSSVNGVIGRRGGGAAYAAAKGGLVAMTRHLALDLAPEVRINCVAPGFIETERIAARPDAAEFVAGLARQIPLMRMGSMRDVGRAILATIENDSMTGAVVSVDGGLAAGH